jgi:hypothetical protein
MSELKKKFNKYGTAQLVKKAENGNLNAEETAVVKEILDKRGIQFPTTTPAAEKKTEAVEKKEEKAAEKKADKPAGKEERVRFKPRGAKEEVEGVILSYVMSHGARYAKIRTDEGKICHKKEGAYTTL